MLMAPEPSSWLAGARDGCSPASGNRKIIRCLICQLSSPPRRPSRPYICGCAKRTRWIQGTHHEILRERYKCRVRDVRAKGVPSTLAAEQVVSFSSKPLMRGHVSWRVDGSSRGGRTGSALSLAIWPTRRHAKSPAEEHHEELGEIDGRHALACPSFRLRGVQEKKSSRDRRAGG